MKLILLPVVLVIAAICSLASPHRYYCSEWRSDAWRYEARRAEREVRRSAWETRRAAMESRAEILREKREFLREMRRQEMEVRREVREAFRGR
ncbi:MAG TPA: hypothetical protein VMT15_10240 [Bryobacteraceae bacterium]|nr:hypothetical protein [Bryobacteraceae bacterium]